MTRKRSALSQPTRSSTQRRPAHRNLAEKALDGIAGWLGRRSRLVRAIVAGLVALAITGTVGMVIYGYLLTLPIGSLQFGPIGPDNLVSVLFVVLLIVGFALYWIGWRLLIGFDFGDEPLRPGRPAAAWVALGLVVLIVTVIVAVVNALIATSPA